MQFIHKRDPHQPTETAQIPMMWRFGGAANCVRTHQPDLFYAYENVVQCILNAKTGNGSLQLCHSNFGRNRRLSQLYGVWLMLHGLNSMVAKTYRDHLSVCLSSIQSTYQKKKKNKTQHFNTVFQWCIKLSKRIRWIPQVPFFESILTFSEFPLSTTWSAWSTL